jgi:hypothetical protein
MICSIERQNHLLVDCPRPSTVHESESGNEVRIRHHGGDALHVLESRRVEDGDWIVDDADFRRLAVRDFHREPRNVVVWLNGLNCHV